MDGKISAMRQSAVVMFLLLIFSGAHYDSILKSTETLSFYSALMTKELLQKNDPSSFKVNNFYVLPLTDDDYSK